VEPDHIEYFYEDLKPWIHYIPVHQNLTNLLTIVKYVLDDENEKQMKSIIHEARTWCQKKITRPQILSDMLDNLNKYSESLYHKKMIDQNGLKVFNEMWNHYKGELNNGIVGIDFNSDANSVLKKYVQ